MGINPLSYSQQSSASLASKLAAESLSSNLSQSTSQKFSELISQAKARLENPLGDVAADDGTGGSVSNNGIESSVLSIGAEDDAFSGVDSMNERVFASIKDTIKQKLAEMKNAEVARSKAAAPLSSDSVEELTQMGLKISELYAASESESYRKTAEKTIANIASKLSDAGLAGDQSAAAGLKSIQSVLPEASRPRFFIDILLEQASAST